MQVARFDDTELDEDSMRKAKDELKETDETRRKCLDVLKRKLLDKENLNPNLEDNFLLAYLRVSKFDCNKAYQRIVSYYEEKWSLPEVFKDYSPSTVKIVENARQLYASPYRSTDNSVIIIAKRSDYDPTKIHYDALIRAHLLIGDLIIRNPLTQMCGGTCVMDLKSSSLGGWSEYTPSRLKLIARLVQKSLILRIRGVHVINAPSIYYLLYSIVYPFLSAKIRNRIFLHKNLASLQSGINPEYLPKEYGGCLEQSELINLFERIYEEEEYFVKLSKYGFMKKKK